MVKKEESMFEGMSIGIEDIDGKPLHCGDRVTVGKSDREAVIKFFPEYGCFGLYEEGHYQSKEGKPLGSSGSSTRYRPYNWKSWKAKRGRVGLKKLS